MRKPDLPWVLLVRENSSVTGDAYLERALMKVSNVATIRNDWRLLDLGRRLSPRKLVNLLDKAYRMKLKVNPPIEPDMILVTDYVQRKIEFKGFDCPKAYYAIDNMYEFGHHIKDSHIQDYDYVFVAQKDWIERYEEIGCDHVYWLPHACDPEVHCWLNTPQSYDVCFCGNVYGGTHRDKIISKLRERFPKMFVGRKYLHDMAKAYSESKIAFNISHNDILCMRVFEALSCKRLLLTDRIGNGLEDIFTNRKHLILYDDYNELVEEIQYYLEKDDEREQIAAQGQREVHKKHTYLHRAKTILQNVLGIQTHLS